jgi:hypothetical protein
MLCVKPFLAYGGVSKSLRIDLINEINYNNNNKHSLRSNTKYYDVKIHEIDSQNSDKTAPGGRELYHLQFSLQAVSPETFGYSTRFYPFLYIREVRF